MFSCSGHWNTCSKASKTVQYFSGAFCMNNCDTLTIVSQFLSVSSSPKWHEEQKLVFANHIHLKRLPCFLVFEAILFFFFVKCRPSDPNFWHFPFLFLNNDFNLENEHSNNIVKNRNKNRNTFYSILCILLIQDVNINFLRHPRC